LMADFNPFDPAIAADPYPLYEELREHDPVHHIEFANIFAVTRYDDIINVARNHEQFSSEQMGPMDPTQWQGAERPPGMPDMPDMPMGGGMMGAADMAGVRFLLNSDPPDHTKLRRLVQKPFTPSGIAALEPRLRSICESLVDELIEAGRDGEVVDLVERLAVPLPVIVIAEMMGIDPARRDDFRRWSNAMTGAMSPEYDFMAGMQP